MHQTVAGLIALAVGISMVFYFCLRWIRWRRVRDWQRTVGQLVNTRMDVGKRIEWPSPPDLFFPVAEYEYTYEARKFTGNRISVHDKRLASTRREKAQKILDEIDQHPVVYVDPSNPGNAVLQNTLSRSHIVFLMTYIGFGVSAALIGLAILTIVPSA